MRDIYHAASSPVTFRAVILIYLGYICNLYLGTRNFSIPSLLGGIVNPLFSLCRFHKRPYFCDAADPTRDIACLSLRFIDGVFSLCAFLRTVFVLRVLFSSYVCSGT